MKTGCENTRPDTRLTAGGIRKSRVSPWRAAALIALNLFMVAHVIQWWMHGRTISPIEPSETMHTLREGVINAGFIFFALALLATLLFGRFVCGWGCHILALQDLCAWFCKKIGLTPKPFRSRLLIYVPLGAALYMFVWPTAYRFFTHSDPVIPAFTNHLVTDNFWATFPSVAVAIPFLIVCGFATVYFLGQKGFCTYACPYGGFFAVADKLSPWRIRVTDACNQCGHCTATCTSNVLVHQEVNTHRMVVDPGCMKCMDCVSVCPNEALYFGFGKPAIARAKTPDEPKRHYSLSWPEEILGALVFLGSLFAVRNVYGLVPFLMALGVAAVSTFLALKLWQLVARSDVYFHRFILKSVGKMRAAGSAFALFAIVWLLLIAHSGWIRYQEFAGNRAFAEIRVPDELALAQADPRPWLAPSDHANARDGVAHLRLTERFGLFANGGALGKLAWLEYLGGDSASAVRHLQQAAEHQSGEAKALSLYYRGALLNRLGRPAEALTDFDRALAERPDILLADQEKGESLWRLGRRDEATRVWADALQRNPQLALTANFLAGARQAAGRIAEANTVARQADRFTPNIPLYHWMLGLRLQALGMTDLANEHFAQAPPPDSR